MMVLIWIGLAVAVWLAGLVRLGGGPQAWLVPSIALAAVLVCARWAPPARHRATALVTGLVAGIPLQGMFLVPAVVLLLLGALAWNTRRLFPITGPIGLFVLGLMYAFLQTALLHLFPATPPTLKLAGGDWTGAVGGLFLTAALFVLLEVAVGHSRKLRHALQRP